MISSVKSKLKSVLQTTKVKRLRNKLAAVLRVEAPSVQKQEISKKKSAPQKPLSANSVAHHEALEWFEKRKANYDALVAATKEFVEPEGVFFDIGANIGYFTMQLAQATSFKGQVFLFEPLPHLAQLCELTLKGVDYQTEVNCYGLSDSSEEIELFTAGDGNIGWNTLIADKASANMKKTLISVKKFTETGISSQPTFIKIDVEGAEYKVLGGLLPAMKTWDSLPVILCEIGWGKSHPQWDQEMLAFEELKALGYTTLDLNRDPIDVSSLTKTTDILFMPSNVL